ncbi:DUF3667 domain-containing protein [Pseudolysobacter antarcticus]|uniref:DUF3667 domain-containing protein n=1 Tax=Pseudolysobacter antarcticus TaxID=2511995 RepID=A0A411HFC4_9GAMM|nr:DUF3667 domain-containing protein [Pseudolysobacter antarcticus]QBB69177.1 DUF3667 domain-containing protein [Pseudolysobacter antarcticus]
MNTTPTNESLELVPLLVAEAPVTPAPGAHCANCRTPLLGPYCYACGQPIKGLIRHLASIFHDLLDTIFNIDSRILHTFFPLYFRPGFLTTEYFAGRRVRYVTPFRLYFFLSVAAFFCIQATLNVSELGKQIKFDNNDGLSGAKTLTELEQRKNTALAGLQTAIEKSPGVAHKSLDKARTAVERSAQKRLEYLTAVEQAKTAGTAIPPDPADEVNIEFGGDKWDAQKNPIQIGWLPDRGNAYLNTLAAHMLENLKRAKHDPHILLAGIFNVLPQTLFVLMPLFAVFLKVFYIFKRRLYMEHLIVALHSHSFILLSLLLVTLVSLLREWTVTAAPWLDTLLSWVNIAVLIWLPLYLLIMQKRVYRQGWIMTVLKFSMIGFCYIFLISFSIVGALLAGLAFT